VTKSRHSKGLENQ